MADLSREESKRLRAELAEGLGFYPASLAPEDVARYREQIAERKAREEAGERDGWGPGGYKWRQWDHLREERSEGRDGGPGTCIGGRPVRLSRGVNERRPSASIRVSPTPFTDGGPSEPVCRECRPDSRVIAATLGLLPA